MITDNDGLNSMNPIFYDFYNREERALCAHLFRLLHERMDDKENSPLRQFVAFLADENLVWTNGQPNMRVVPLENPAIYCEVALIRDKYKSEKVQQPDEELFVDKLVRHIAVHRNFSQYRRYSELEKELHKRDEKTHPRQIKHQARQLGIVLNSDEVDIYGEVQSMFNAKPDLAITFDNVLLVCEAKFTERFDGDQFQRTNDIAEVWAKLLYEDLGFSQQPKYTVFKLGASAQKPHISWEQVLTIAEIYDKSDRTRIAIEAAVDLLRKVDRKRE